MSSPTVRRVVIAGGGTAGWISAAALSHLLGPLIEVTLVESEDIGTVGVGEATIPTQRTFHALLGINEVDFMKATQASFKLGIAFENWGLDGDRYIHSFGQVGKGNWMGDFQHVWLNARDRGLAGDFGEYCYELRAAEANKFYTGEKSRLNFAYHLDAGRYAKFLRERSEKKGVTRIEGKIASVDKDPQNGNIAALVMEDGTRVEGDLFIDCTGFRGLLIEKALDVGYEDWTHWLATDSAQAVQTRSTGPAIPYTRAIAHDAGWQWRIPLQHRIGNGLVYCSEFLSDDEAKARLLANIDGETITEPRLIRYRTGRRKQVWHKNCIAFGLSSGFLEPLESTSIHLIQAGITRLVQTFPLRGITPAMIDRFNRQAKTEMEEVRDFIILHYKATERDDSAFWRRCRDMDIPDSLAQRMELFRETAHTHRTSEELFRVDSWLQVMMGQRIEPQSYHPIGQLMSDEQMQGALSGLKANIDKAVSSLPTHQAFLEKYCPAPMD